MALAPRSHPLRSQALSKMVVSSRPSEWLSAPRSACL
jgi:hypothetical protein